MKDMEKIVGNTIVLRKMQEADTNDIVRWRNSDFVKKNFIYRQPFTIEGHHHWIETMILTGKAIQFIICEKSTGRSVGSVYFRDIDKLHRKAEYGIFLGEKDALGKGYGTEAATLMLRYGFEVLELHKIMLRVLADNTAARRSYEKAGFLQEAYLKEDVFLDGQYKDIILMAAINGENQNE